jgi:tetratricopeptide (TPR) repeat protein
MGKLLRLTVLLLAAVTAASCRGDRGGEARAVAASVPACDRALAPLPAGEAFADDIADWQTRARRGHRRELALERLAHAAVARVRLVDHAGGHALAEDAIACLESARPRDAESILLRGHLRHQQHRFREAESLARQAVAMRGSTLDYGLLGDALVERGRLNDAFTAYQRMVDLRPFYQSYVRAAHVRWLQGDLEGASTMTRLAIDSASPRDPEARAWASARLAFYELESGRLPQADRAADAALTIQSDYAPALAMKGRLALARGDARKAAGFFRRAVGVRPDPDYQWALADTLREAGEAAEAATVEFEIARTGAARDPRTFAIYLATRGERPADALELVERELEERADPFTLDAHAWALASAGRREEARARIAEAVASGIPEARLLLHAGLIAADAGQTSDAQRWLTAASRKRHLLWPSEQSLLTAARARIGAR